MSQNAAYDANHRRVRKARGKARDAGPCADCGGVARTWSQVRGTDGTDPHAHFEPRCYSCHYRYDRRQPVRHALVTDDIAGRIERGELMPGARLPSTGIAAEYGVSRDTAERVRRQLRQRGLVRTVPGEGTFVTRT